MFQEQVPENVTLARQFKELAKRHLHIIAYSGERMYNGYDILILKQKQLVEILIVRNLRNMFLRFETRTKEFVNNLNPSLSLVNDDISASQKIQRVIDVVTIQLQDIEKCRQDFKVCCLKVATNTPI